jgi:hypothetical protein
MMQFVITPLYLVLAAVIGLLVGMLVSNLLSQRENKTTTPEQPPKELAQQGFSEALRLWYSPKGKKVITYLDGEYYREYLTLSPEQKGRVNRILDLWTEWSGRNLQKKAEPAVFTTDGQPADTSSLQPILVDSVAEAIKEEEEPEKQAGAKDDQPKTIAGQISKIIDKMLEGNPLREKGIRLIENAHQGVDVWIGLEKFDGIDAIPYPEVQQLIREAVAEWERESEKIKK